jgi:hypothetical protein
MMSETHTIEQIIPYDGDDSDNLLRMIQGLLLTIIEIEVAEFRRKRVPMLLQCGVENMGTIHIVWSPEIRDALGDADPRTSVEIAAAFLLSYSHAELIKISSADLRTALRPKGTRH